MIKSSARKEIVDEQAPFVAGLGSISRDNLDTMTDINEAVARRMGKVMLCITVQPTFGKIFQMPTTVFMPNGM